MNFRDFTIRVGNILLLISSTEEEDEEEGVGFWLPFWLTKFSLFSIFFNVGFPPLIPDSFLIFLIYSSLTIRREVIVMVPFWLTKSQMFLSENILKICSVFRVFSRKIRLHSSRLLVAVPPAQ